MKLNPADMAERSADGLPAAILVFGPEPLLVEESLDRLREILASQQFNERVRLSVERGFNWDEVSGNASAMSLFSERRCFELRMPSGRPGDKGSRAIAEFCAAGNTDTLLLMICERLDGRQLQSKWVKAINAVGWLVDCGDVPTRAFPTWLRNRTQSKGLRLEQGVLEALVFYLEGNLLAAAQEIDKLSVLARDGAVTMDLVGQSMGDQARFSTFALVDTCLAGESAKAARILSSLRSEGTRPELVVWTLAREIRAMSRIAGAMAQGNPRGAVYKANRIWSRREPAVNAAMQRFSAQDWCTMVSRVGELDRLVKGQAGPVSRDGIWHEAEILCLALAGAELVGADEYGSFYGTGKP